MDIIAGVMTGGAFRDDQSESINDENDGNCFDETLSMIDSDFDVIPNRNDRIDNGSDLFRLPSNDLLRFNNLDQNVSYPMMINRKDDCNGNVPISTLQDHKSSNQFDPSQYLHNHPQQFVSNPSAYQSCYRSQILQNNHNESNRSNRYPFLSENEIISNSDPMSLKLFQQNRLNGSKQLNDGRVAFEQNNQPTIQSKQIHHNHNTIATQKFSNENLDFGAMKLLNQPQQQQQQQSKTKKFLHKKACTKHVEVLNFVLKGGPPWGFRIKQRNGNVFISKVNCGGRGHKGGLRVHDEIMAVNNFELVNHPLTLHRKPLENHHHHNHSILNQSASQSSAMIVAMTSNSDALNNNINDVENVKNQNHSNDNGGSCLNPTSIDDLELTKLDFTYQLIKHTLNRQLQLTVRRWHSDWELAPSIFLPISSASIESGQNCRVSNVKSQRSKIINLETKSKSSTNKLMDDSEGPLHQSEEELLSPNEELGPESRQAHRKLLINSNHPHYYQNFMPNPQLPIYSSDSSMITFHSEQATTPTARYPSHHSIRIAMPTDRIGSFSDYNYSTKAIVGNENSLGTYSRSSNDSTSTTTTGCLIARTAHAIQQEAEALHCQQQQHRQQLDICSSIPSSFTSTTTDQSCTTCMNEINHYRHHWDQYNPSKSSVVEQCPLSKPSQQSSSYIDGRDVDHRSTSIRLSDDNNSFTTTTENDIDYDQVGSPFRDGEPEQTESDDIGQLDLSPDGNDRSDLASSISSPSLQSCKNRSNENYIINSSLNFMSGDDDDDDNDNEDIETVKFGRSTNTQIVDDLSTRVTDSRNIWSPTVSTKTPASPSSSFSSSGDLTQSPPPPPSPVTTIDSSPHQINFVDQTKEIPYDLHQVFKSAINFPESDSNQSSRVIVTERDYDKLITTPPYSFRERPFFRDDHSKSSLNSSIIRQLQQASHSTVIASSSNIPASVTSTIVDSEFASQTNRLTISASKAQQNDSNRDQQQPKPQQRQQQQQQQQIHHIQIERAFNNTPQSVLFQFNSSGSEYGSLTLPKNVTMMSSIESNHALNQHQQQSHVADVYAPKQHPVHKYWTLPRALATGDGFGTYTTAEECPTEEERLKAQQTKQQSSNMLEKADIQQQPVLYVSNDVTFYTLSPPPPPLPPPQQEPLISGGSEKINPTITNTISVSGDSNPSVTYATPLKKQQSKQQQQQQQQQQTDQSSSLSSKQNSEWYKNWLREMEIRKSFDSNNMVVKIRPSKYKGNDYHLTIDDKPIISTSPPFPIGNIEDYEPGIKNSIFEREKQMFYKDIFNYIDSIFAEVIASTASTLNNQKHQSSKHRKRAQSLSRMSSSSSLTAMANRFKVSNELNKTANICSSSTSLPLQSEEFPKSSLSLPSLRCLSMIAKDERESEFFFKKTKQQLLAKLLEIAQQNKISCNRRRRFSAPSDQLKHRSRSRRRSFLEKKSKRKFIKNKKDAKKRNEINDDDDGDDDDNDDDDDDNDEDDGEGDRDGDENDDKDDDVDEDDIDGDRSESDDDDDDKNDHNRDGQNHRANNNDDNKDNEDDDDDDDDVHEYCPLASGGIRGSNDDEANHYGDDEISSQEERTYIRKIKSKEIDQNDFVAKKEFSRQKSPKNERKPHYHHENCVFNQLTSMPSVSNGPGSGSVSGGSGYDSDSSYVIRKRTIKSVPKPASPSVYRAVQRGEDIPFEGLQMPAPNRQTTHSNQRANKLNSFDETNTEDNDSGLGFNPSKSNRSDDFLDPYNLDEWQSRINEEFDCIYDALKSNQQLRSPTTKTQKPISPKKKSVVFDAVEEVQLIEADDDFDEEDDYDVDDDVNMMNHYAGEYDEIEDEYAYGGLLRPGSHRPANTAHSFDHFLNTQPNLEKKVAHLKNPNQRVRITTRRHRSKSPNKSNAGATPPIRSDSQSETEFGTLSRSFQFLPVQSPLSSPTLSNDKFMNPLSPVRTATIVGEPSDSKINVQYRLPNNSLIEEFNYNYASSVPVKSHMQHYVGPCGTESCKQTTLVMKNLMPTQSSPQRLNTNRAENSFYNAQHHHYVPHTSMSPVALDRYERNPNKDSTKSSIARVLFDFQAKARNELAVKKGDLVAIRRDINAQWVEVEDCSSGLVGFVPRSYLDLDQHGLAKAKFDFNAKTNVEISFKKGEKLILLRRIDENWFEGINSRQEIGIFPVSYVEVIKKIISNFIESSSSDQSHESPSSSSTVIVMSNPSDTFESLQQSKISQSVMENFDPNFSEPSKSNTIANKTIDKRLMKINPDETIQTNTTEYLAKVHQIKRAPEAIRQFGTNVEKFCLPKAKIFRVLYPYKPKQNDELELQYGDLLTVTIQCDDGWYLGRSTLSGKFGTFPGNYVEPA